MSTRTVHDPFTGADVLISNRLVDRLRGKYASGPHLPNGNPEFGWRQFQAPPIQHEAATRIEELEAALLRAIEWGVSSKGYDGGMALALRQWIEAGMSGQLPAEPEWLRDMRETLDKPA